MDARRNFAYGTVATPPSPALSGTSLTLDAGQGARFPNPSGEGAFNAVVWPAGALPLASNAEITRVTARATDVFSTIARSQEGSSARTIIAGDQVALCATDKVFDDLETLIAGAASDLAAHTADTTGVHGIADTGELVVDSDPRLSDQRTPSANSVDSSKIVNGSVAIGDLAFDPATQAELDALSSAAAGALAAHESDTTAIHGIANTALLETTSGAQAKADAAQAASQPVDSDLTAIAALTTTAFGRGLLALADAAVARTSIGVVIGTDVQAFDSDLAAIAALSTTSYGRSLLAAANAAALRTLAGTIIGTDVQAWDADLDSIAALTTTSIGRSLLAAADAAALRTILAIPSVPIGTIVDYIEFTADTTVTATTEATAQAIVTGAGFTPNGTDSFWIEFFCPAVLTGAGAGAQLRFSLYDNGAAIASGASLLGQFLTPAAASSLGAAALLRRKVTPSNAAHAYSIRAWRLVANGVVDGSNAGIGLPGYIAITKAA